VATADKYLVFAGKAYYPEGGWRDFKGIFDSLEEAREFLDERLVKSVWGPTWADIVNGLYVVCCLERRGDRWVEDEAQMRVLRREYPHLVAQDPEEKP